MTFPALVGSPVASGINTGTLSATLPASRTAGNILRATVFWNARTTPPTAPTGWAYVPAVGGGDAFVSANGGCLAIFARVATNTGDDALALPSGGAISAVVEQITDPGGFGLAGLIATMISDWAGTGNPPSLATGWNADNLFTAVQGINTDSIAQNSWPSTYSLGRASSFNGGLWGRASVASAQIAAATDDPPGAFQAFGDGVNNLLGTTAVRGTAPAGPVITGPATFNLAENDTSSGPLFSTDIGLGAGFPTLGGVDAALFNLVSVGANQWRAVKLVGGNFEAPDDSGANRVYDLVFNASASVSAPCAITLTNVVELPGAPTIGIASAGNATVTINGTPPAANGSPSVTGYQATLSPGAITKTGATLPIIFTGADGVVNGTAYTGTLRAINSDGTGPASASSNPVTPSTGATATAVTLTPPTPASGSVGVASGAFTVGVNGTLGAGVTRVVTPSAGAGGGSFSPATVSLTDAQPTATFTYTPASEGAKSITLTNDGSLSNPAAVSYTVTPPAVTYSATVGPFGGNTGAGQRAAGTAFEAWVFPPGFVLGDAPPTTAPLRIAGTLNASGLAVLTGLPAAGTGEVWFMFPSDPQPAKADRGTARGRYTAA